jgi:hypothetical protein
VETEGETDDMGNLSVEGRWDAAVSGTPGGKAALRRRLRMSPRRAREGVSPDGVPPTRGACAQSCSTASRLPNGAGGQLNRRALTTRCMETGLTISPCFGKRPRFSQAHRRTPRRSRRPVSPLRSGASARTNPAAVPGAARPRPCRTPPSPTPRSHAACPRRARSGA